MDTKSEHAYDEILRMAGSAVRRERRDHTLQATGLANEVFLSIGLPSDKWQNKSHYFGAVARTMRQILVEYARGRKALKRGGQALRVTLDHLQNESTVNPFHHGYDIRNALAELDKHDSTLRRLVELRYFEGHSLEEVARITGRSSASVKRDWNYTRAWLFRYLTQ